MPSKYKFEQWVRFPRDQVFLFFANPANLLRIMPPKLDTRIDALHLKAPVIPSEAEGSCAARPVQSLAGTGSEISTSFRVLPFLPFRATWVALITEFEWNHHFADVQMLGPFHSFHHRHELKPEVSEGVVGTVVKDEVELDVGYGWAGKVIEKLFVSAQMRQTFQHRQRILPKLLAQDYREGSTKTAVP
jgi:ligand-binding SRPBCC domain-containing protein